MPEKVSWCRVLRAALSKSYLIFKLYILPKSVLHPLPIHYVQRGTYLHKKLLQPELNGYDKLYFYFFTLMFTRDKADFVYRVECCRVKIGMRALH